MLCDNNQLRLFTVRGLSRQIDISILEINNTRYNNNNNNNKQSKSYDNCDLYFSNITVQTERIQQVVICNDTGISIEYEWLWVPENTERKNIKNVAEVLIRCKKIEIKLLNNFI